MMKLGRVTKVKVLFLALVFVFNFRPPFWRRVYLSAFRFFQYDVDLASNFYKMFHWLTGFNHNILKSVDSGCFLLSSGFLPCAK